MVGEKRDFLGNSRREIMEGIEGGRSPKEIVLALTRKEQLLLTEMELQRAMKQVEGAMTLFPIHFPHS